MKLVEGDSSGDLIRCYRKPEISCFLKFFYQEDTRQLHSQRCMSTDIYPGGETGREGVRKMKKRKKTVILGKPSLPIDATIGFLN